METLAWGLPIAAVLIAVIGLTVVRSGSTEGSLLSAIDRTRSAMGARLLRQWLRFPLCDLEHIAARHDAIAAIPDRTPDQPLIREGSVGIGSVEKIDTEFERSMDGRDRS